MTGMGRWLRRAQRWMQARRSERQRRLAQAAWLTEPMAFRPRHAWTSSLTAPPGPAAERPLVSAIVLNRDGAAHLAALLASLHDHNTYAPLELIIVDHGSTDASLDVIRHWQGLLSIRVIRCRENHSFSFSCNRAAEVATGDVLMLLNNDIVFPSDVVGTLVDSLLAGDGMVGIRQFNHLPEAAGVFLGPEHHIGIRFEWNRRRRFLMPVNAVAAPGDELTGRLPARFFGVTGSLALCRRDDYLRLGGLDEGYAYGYEDIDLCLKFHLRDGAPVTSRNDVFVLHGEGRTRKRRPTHARDRHIHNMGVYDRRFGYAMRRHYPAVLYGGDGALPGRVPRVLIVFDRFDADAAEHDGHFLRAFGAAVSLTLGWEVSFVPAARLRHAVDVDLLVVATPAVRLDHLEDWGDHTLVAAWVLDRRDAWRSHPDWPAYDLRLAAGAATADHLSTTTGLPVAVLERAANTERFGLNHVSGCRRAGTVDARGLSLDEVADRFAGAEEARLDPAAGTEGPPWLAFAAAASGARPVGAEGDLGPALGLPASMPPGAPLRQAFLEAGHALPRRAAALRHAVVTLLEDRHRFAVKLASVTPWWQEVAHGLRARGHAVRLDLPAAWDNARALCDDVIVLAARPGAWQPPPGRITLAAQPVDEAPADCHAILPVAGRSAEAMILALEATAEEWHHRLKDGPADPPLPDLRRPLPPDVAAWWEEESAA